jgi:hypothetical protein
MTTQIIADHDARRGRQDNSRASKELKMQNIIITTPLTESLKAIAEEMKQLIAKTNLADDVTRVFFWALSEPDEFEAAVTDWGGPNNHRRMMALIHQFEDEEVAVIMEKMNANGAA